MGGLISFSEAEVADIIKVHDAEYNPLDKWNNVGFRETGNDTNRWFSKYVSREQILLAPLTEDNTYYPAEIVLNELMRLRDDLLVQIPIDESAEQKNVVGEEDAA